MARRRRSNWSLAISILSLLLAIISLVLTAATLSELQRVPEEVRTKRVSAEALQQLWIRVSESEPRVAVSPVKPAPWNGLCRMYGAGSVESFRRAIESDSVLIRHFAGFQWASARAMVLAEHRTAYVAYRREDRIAWTRRPISLVQGETLLTDGKTTVRGYCCNEIVDNPVAPVDEAGPFTTTTVAAKELATPAQAEGDPEDPDEVVLGLLPLAPIAEPVIPAPPEEASAGPILPLGPILAGDSIHEARHDNGGPASHDQIPEPASALLVGTGLVLFVLLLGPLSAKRMSAGRKGLHHKSGD